MTTRPKWMADLISNLKVDVKIMSLRAASWHFPSTPATCPTCTRPLSVPYRRRNAQAQIVEGCIDACHGESLASDPHSDSAAWHFRATAVAWRKSCLANLIALRGD